MTRFFDISGLRIACDESGDPDGAPVFFFHGWPASRLQGAGFGPVARELGLRIICPDRPGIGLSTFQAGRRLLDWPPLVRAMARELGLERIRIVAVSGGGPYALATAFAEPDLVEAVSVVCGAPPLGPGVDRGALLWAYRFLLAVYRRHPGLLRSAFKLARPVATYPPPSWSRRWLLRLLPAADRAPLEDPAVFEGSFECYREAWRGSARGVAADAEIYADEWGFRPEEVKAPVQVWHGKEDRNFSWRLAAELAKRLPMGEGRFLEGEGHYSLPIRRRGEIMRELVRAHTKP